MHIIAAAIKVGDQVFHAPQPARHHHVIQVVRAAGLTAHGGIQGFITEDGGFVDRREGASIALASGQIKGLGWPPDLYSEDLW